MKLSDCICETKSCVACDVMNCVYHTENNVCSAGQIKIGNGIAKDCKDTCCDTFKAK